jgi:hypothetical protein
VRDTRAVFSKDPRTYHRLRISTEPATFKCSNSECWVSEYLNAALNIADRYLSGESHSREHTSGDNSAEEGGRLTVPQDSQADADTQQETLVTYAS